MNEISTRELFLWISDIKKNKQDNEDFYLLLDLVGGISKSELYLLKINAQEKVNLNVDF